MSILDDENVIGGAGSNMSSENDSSEFMADGGGVDCRHGTDVLRGELKE